MSSFLLLKRWDDGSLGNDILSLVILWILCTYMIWVLAVRISHDTVFERLERAICNDAWNLNFLTPK